MCLVKEIAESLYIINKHAKTALDPNALYQLKNRVIQKLISMGKAEKLGLHYSDDNQFSKRKYEVLVKVNTYYFHIPATKNDFKTLPVLGEKDKSFRNSKVYISLKKAKKTCINFLIQNGEYYEKNEKKRRVHNKYRFNSNYFN